MNGPRKKTVSRQKPHQTPTRSTSGRRIRHWFKPKLKIIFYLGFTIAGATSIELALDLGCRVTVHRFEQQEIRPSVGADTCDSARSPRRNSAREESSAGARSIVVSGKNVPVPIEGTGAALGGQDPRPRRSCGWSRLLFARLRVEPDW